MERDPGELVALPAGTVRLRDARRAIGRRVPLPTGWTPLRELVNEEVPR